MLPQKFNQTAIELSQANIIDAFIADKDVKQSSRTTYRRALLQFFVWAQARDFVWVETQGYLLPDIAKAQIIEFKDWLLASGKSNLSACSYITTVRLFYAFCESHRIFPNIARDVKNPKRKQQIEKQPLTAAKSVELMDITADNLRDHAMITLLLHCGLRTIEVVRANIGDITWRAGKRVLMVHGKGHDSKDTAVIIADEVWQALNAYLQAERKGARLNEPLFASYSRTSEDKRLDTRSIRKRVRKYMDSIGLTGKEYTAHSLRHTAGISILRSGGTPEEAQRALRHASPVTTQIYINHDNEERYLQSGVESRLAAYFKSARTE